MHRFTRRTAIAGTFGLATLGIVVTSGRGMTRVLADHDEDATPSASPAASPLAGENMELGGTGAAYLTIANAGTEPDRLVGGATALAQTVEFHESVDNAGVMEMRPLEDGPEIPANGEVVFEPGGYHVMLINLTQDLVVDLTYDLTLTFETAGEVVVPVTVQRSAPEGDEITSVQLGNLTISGAWSRPAPALLHDEAASPEAGHSS